MTIQCEDFATKEECKRREAELTAAGYSEVDYIELVARVDHTTAHWSTAIRPGECFGYYTDSKDEYDQFQLIWVELS